MKKTICAPLLALLLIVTLYAGETRYLLAPAESFFAQIPPPPADDTLAGLADLETVLQVQKDRTPAQIARARRADKLSSAKMGASVFGPEFTMENMPRTVEFLQAVTLERHLVVDEVKKQWSRTRPYDRGLGIEPCVGRPSNTSYPSGHSAAVAVWATLYSAAIPEYTILFENEMRETMWCRVLGGAHYPSDTQAGKILGVLIAKEILKNPAARERIKEIRAEVDALLKKHPAAAAYAQERLAFAGSPQKK